MEQPDRQYFELLKAEIARVMQLTNPGMSNRPETWKGKEIALFQEDVQRQVQVHFSEKWFYTHFKSAGEKLPRIDSLNFLCRYAGYADWSSFKDRNREKAVLFSAQKGSNKVFYFLPFLSVLVFVLIWVLIKVGGMATYRFCFIDSYSKEPIVHAGTEVTLLLENESPMKLTCDSVGCFVYRTGASRLRFIVNAPFYHPDTITRIMNRNVRSEEIQLKINDYALMMDYFANAKVDDWKKRKAQLHEMIADSAYICQVIYGSMMGVELFNKQEFIDLLTIPSTGLKGVKIIEMLYKDDKIISIRFTRGNE